MARKGSRKVKTGCLTCKVRKVKCDEAKPHCERCTSTGRKCDGYAPPPQAHSAVAAAHKQIQWVTGDSSPSQQTWVLAQAAVGLGISAPRATVSESESRALDFFRSVVAPVISGHIRSSFWTQIVLQVSPQEPAIRHAVAAISSLYEGFGERHERDTFALQQYNRSLNQLRQRSDPATVLVACVLMICVEFLQGNMPSAIEHCRHGIAILNSPSTPEATREALLPIFCRLSIFPFLFGASPTQFPMIDQLKATSLARPAPANVAELQTSIDIVIPMCVRFVRLGEAYRDGPPEEIPADILTQQADLRALLDRWRAHFDVLCKTRLLSPADLTSCHILEVRYLIAVIWIATALEPSEAAYDVHLPRFQRIVDLSTLVLAHSLDRGSRPKFLFEMGFLPLMFFVVVKCRSLCTRVAALHAMRALASTRENLWDVDVNYAVGQEVIRLEHNVEIGAPTPLVDTPEAVMKTKSTVKEVMRRVVETSEAVVDGRATKRVEFRTIAQVKREQPIVIRERILIVDDERGDLRAEG